MVDRQYNVVILGAGITGSALTYVLNRYTSIERVAVIEKEVQPGQANTSSLKNSQTLHVGDIETNYSLEKSQKVKAAATMTMRYLDRIKNNNGIFARCGSMALAFGETEVRKLSARYDMVKGLFPYLQKLGRDEIAQVEPAIVAGRDERVPLLALRSPESYMVDYGKLAEHFLRETKEHRRAVVDQFFSTTATTITKNKDGYTIVTNQGTFTSKVVVVALGTYSLFFAKSLGYGHDYFILPMAGDYYSSTRRLLNGKVYTMQTEKLPFVAVHGDPSILNQNETRFGPTTCALPVLERGSLKSFGALLRSVGFGWGVVASLLKITADRDVFAFLTKNFLFTIPFVGRHLFLNDCRKIIPTMTSRDLKAQKSTGGIRPQLVLKKERKIHHTTAEIIGDNIIFNITPSPGASVCLDSAEKMTKQIMEFFNGQCSFDQARFDADYKV